MFKLLMRTMWSLLVVVGLVGLLPATALAGPPQQQAVACEQTYAVQAGDWLSRIAQDTYGDTAAYAAIVQATNAQAEGFATIDNPDVIEVGWNLCLPSQSEAMAMLGETGPMVQPEQAEQALTAPEGEMLMVVRNLSKENAPSTFTISGGEFAGGEQLMIDPGEERQLELEAGDYRVIWSSPATEEDVNVGRRFTAVPGTVATAQFIPENDRAMFRFNVNQEQQEQMEAPEAEMEGTTEMDREFPFEPPAGKGMLVVSNRSKEAIPSTLTISGGRFGGGEQITVNPGDEIFLAVEPGEFTLNWSAPVDQAGEETGESVIVSRRMQVSAGESPLLWVTPEEFRAFIQTPGSAPQELAQ